MVYDEISIRNQKMVILCSLKKMSLIKVILVTLQRMKSTSLLNYKNIFNKYLYEALE